MDRCPKHLANEIKKVDCVDYGNQTCPLCGKDHDDPISRTYRFDKVVDFSRSGPNYIGKLARITKCSGMKKSPVSRVSCKHEKCDSNSLYAIFGDHILILGYCRNHLDFEITRRDFEEYGAVFSPEIEKHIKLCITPRDDSSIKSSNFHSKTPRFDACVKSGSPKQRRFVG